DRRSYSTHGIDTPDTPNTSNTSDTSCSINFLYTFFTNTTNSLHTIRRINPSDTPHNTDYKNIMQYQDMKSKPLDQLRKRFHISTSRLYQI
ncbi:8221_t:CDS:2, partial [Funneliformis caledonium]